jgi:hypothetical protein
MRITYKDHAGKTVTAKVTEVTVSHEQEKTTTIKLVATNTSIRIDTRTKHFVRRQLVQKVLSFVLFRRKDGYTSLHNSNEGIVSP